MPDLGKYAFEVTLAYGMSLGLLAALIAWVLVRSRRVRTMLKEIEARRPDKGSD